MFKRIVSCMLSFAVILTVIAFRTTDLTIKADALADPDVNGNMYYYIKNVRSGKYLTCQHDSTDVGTNIIQYVYTGHDSQIWKLQYYGDQYAFAGTYQILPIDDTNKAIQMETAQNQNGIFAKLAAKDNDVKQFFKISSLNNGAKRFITNGSNFTKVLEINGASVYNNARLLQYSQVGNGSDQWLLEPATFDPNNGVTYSYYQIGGRIMTYPNFSNYSSSNLNQAYDSMNFVSQCLCASGYRYTNSTYNWYCNKEEFFQPSSFNTTELYNNWNISQAWYKGEFAKYFLINQASAWQAYRYGDVISNSSSSLNSNPTVYPHEGGVVLVTYIDNGVETGYAAGYVYDDDDSPSINSSNWNQNMVRYHKLHSGATDTVKNFVVETKNTYNLNINKMRIYIINKYPSTGG